MRARTLFLAATALTAIAAYSADEEMDDVVRTGFPPANERLPVPDSARVALRFPEGTDFVLGDSIVVTFVLSNVAPRRPILPDDTIRDGEIWTSGTPNGADDPSLPGRVLIEVGGDDRATGFHTRYKVDLIGSDGEALMAELYGSLGGIMVRFEVLGGGEYRQTLYLENYLRIDRPGDYTVRISNDFGWQPTTENPLPVAEGQLSIRLPSPDEAEARVQAIVRDAPAPEEFYIGHWHVATPFRYLAHSVYLPALEQAAAAGRIDAMEGIHRIATPDATDSLVNLLANDSLPVVNAASEFLGRRLPPGDDSTQYRFNWLASSDEKARLADVWIESAEGPLRTAALRLLESDDSRYARTGAVILTQIGVPANGETVLQALDTELNRPPNLSNVGTLSDGPQDTVDVLFAALTELREQGYRAPDEGGDAVLVAQLLEIPDRGGPLRENWESLIRTGLEHGLPIVRTTAVQAIPTAADGSWEPLLVAALSDVDWSVVREAARAAGSSQNSTYVDPLVALLRQQYSQWVDRFGESASQSFVFREGLSQSLSTASVLDTAITALTNLGAHEQAVDNWVDWLAQPTFASSALSFLTGKLDLPDGTAASFTLPPEMDWLEFREIWRTFLADPDRRELIRAGQLVPVSEPEARALFGGFYKFELPDGTLWPADD